MDNLRVVVDFVANGQICKEQPREQTCLDFHEFPEIFPLMNFVAFAKKVYACSIALSTSKWKRKADIKSDREKFETKKDFHGKSIAVPIASQLLQQNFWNFIYVFFALLPWLTRFMFMLIFIKSLCSA